MTEGFFLSGGALAILSRIAVQVNRRQQREVWTPQFVNLTPLGFCRGLPELTSTLYLMGL